MRQKVVIGNNTTWLFPASTDVSHVLIVPCPEAPVNVQWAIWMNGNDKHKLAQNVRHKNQPIAQNFHDCGMLIPHLSPLDWAVGPSASSRKIFFSAMDVLAQGKSVGFALITESPPTPMLSCGLIPLPVGEAWDAASNGVIVGMDPVLDYELCWEGIVVEIAVAAVQVGVQVAVMALSAGGIAAKSLVGIVGELVASQLADPQFLWETGNYYHDWFNPGEIVIDDGRRPVRNSRPDPTAWDEI